MRTFLGSFPKHAAGLELLHNPHKSEPVTIAEYESDRQSYGDAAWVSAEERRKALETDELWTLCWYPITHIGCIDLWGSTLEAVLASSKNPDLKP